MAGADKPPKSVYPEPKSGPLGQNHARYSVTPKWGNHFTGGSLTRFIIMGVIIVTLAAFILVLFLTGIGKSNLR
jgi:hypothetical protein